MQTTISQGPWFVEAKGAGTIAGRHRRSDTRWTIEPESTGEVRLTVYPDAATYGWLVFRSRGEALKFVMGSTREGRSDNHISRQIAAWLEQHASSS